MKRDVEISTEVSATLDRVREILIGDPGLIVAERLSAAERQARAFRTALHVELGAGGGIEQEIDVHIGLGHATEHAFVLPVSWRAVGRRRALPTFDGELEAVSEGLRSRLVLRGTYRLPLGILGGLGDRLAGRRLAHRSLVAFVEQVAGRLAKEARRRADTAPTSAPPYPIDLRDR